MRTARWLVLLGLVAMTAACSPVKFRVKVIEGELSTVQAISQNDPRFQGEGIADAEVTISQTGRAGDVIMRMTNANGSASIPLKGTGALSRPMGVVVRAQGYLPAMREQMPTPTPGTGLPILLEPIGASQP